MCEITFTSLYNKRSHYLGKIHSQTLVERLNKLLDCKRLHKVGQGGKGREDKQLALPPPTRSAHGDAAVASSSYNSDLVSEVGHGTAPEDTLSSSLCNKEQLQTGDCEDGAETIIGISEVNSGNGPQTQEPRAHSEHVAMETTETPCTLQCNTSPTVSSKRVPADLSSPDGSTSSAGSQFSEGSCNFDSVSAYLHRQATAYQCKLVGNTVSVTSTAGRGMKHRYAIQCANLVAAGN